MQLGSAQDLTHRDVFYTFKDFFNYTLVYISKGWGGSNISTLSVVSSMIPVLRLQRLLHYDKLFLLFVKLRVKIVQSSMLVYIGKAGSSHRRAGLPSNVG